MTGSHRVRCVYWNAQIYYTESRAFVPNLFAVLWTSKMGRHLLVLHLSALWVCTVANVENKARKTLKDFCLN